MNKLFISIIAIAALSGAAYANNRSYDVRDSDTCMGKYCSNAKQPSASNTLSVISPLAIEEKDFGLSNFERMKKLSEENDHGRH
jgi:flagellar motor component MotA